MELKNEIRKCLNDSIYRLPVSSHDTAVFVVDRPLAAEALAQITLSFAKEFATFISNNAGIIDNDFFVNNQILTPEQLIQLFIEQKTENAS